MLLQILFLPVFVDVKFPAALPDVFLTLVCSPYVLLRLPSIQKFSLNSVHQTTQWSLPTAPSTKYARPSYTFTSSESQSKVPKAPLLPVYARPEFVISHGKGSYVWDTEGRKYLDFTAGIAVNALGHADEGVLKVRVMTHVMITNSLKYWARVGSQ